MFAQLVATHELPADDAVAVDVAGLGHGLAAEHLGRQPRGRGSSFGGTCSYRVPSVGHDIAVSCTRSCVPLYCVLSEIENSRLD